MRVPSSPRLSPPFDGGRTGRQFSGVDEHCSARGLSGCRLFGARHLAVGAGDVAVGLIHISGRAKVLWSWRDSRCFCSSRSFVEIVGLCRSSRCAARGKRRGSIRQPPDDGTSDGSSASNPNSDPVQRTASGAIVMVGQSLAAMKLPAARPSQDLGRTRLA
jgi:hypothetical protein